MKLQDLVDSIDAVELLEGHSVTLLRTSPKIVLGYEVPGMPEVDKTARYLAVNYITAANVPGVVKFDTLEEACDFVGKLGPVDYKRILGFANMVYEQGWQDAIYAYTDAWIGKLPVEADGKPCWVELPDFEGAELVTTVNSSNVYGSLRDVAQPENETAILVKTIFDDGESHVEMSYCLEAFEIEEDSLEEFLAERLVVNNGCYAFVPRTLMAAIWLLPVPENLEFFEAAVASEDFKQYYDENAYVYGSSNINERKEAIEDWLEAVEKEVDAWTYDDEDEQEFRLLLAELRENYV